MSTSDFIETAVVILGYYRMLTTETGFLGEIDAFSARMLFVRVFRLLLSANSACLSFCLIAALVTEKCTTIQRNQL